jgi:hypothetical protein
VLVVSADAWQISQTMYTEHIKGNERHYLFLSIRLTAVAGLFSFSAFSCWQACAIGRAAEKLVGLTAVVQPIYDVLALMLLKVLLPKTFLHGNIP